MPRPRGRPPLFRNHPLYKLRKIMGGKVPMTQPALAATINAPEATMKALEAGERGTRGLSPAILEKIHSATGAQWNADTKRWEFQRLPYTREIFLQFRSFLEAALPAPRRQHLTEQLCWALKVLVDAAGDERFNALRFSIWRAIFDWKNQFGISGKIVLGGRTMTEEEFDAGSEGKEETIELTELLEKLRPAFAIQCDPETGKPKSFTEMEGYCLPAFADRLIVDPSQTPVKTRKKKSAKTVG